MSNLTTRASTAIVFVLVMLAGVYFSVYSLLLLFLLINILCLVEYSSITSQLPGGFSNRAIFLSIIGSALYLLITLVAMNILPFAYLVFALPLYLLLFLQSLFTISESPINHLAHKLLALLWITIPCALFVPLSIVDGSFEPFKLMGVMLLVWSSDTFAYFVGSQIGKTPLFTRVSPKKTWEGSLGGLVACLIIAFLLSLLLPDWSWGKWSIIAVLAVVFGTLGDLTESLLKRSVNIKDSGTILPGHGGFLDRFDAMLFAIPFIYAFVYFARFIGF